MMKSTAKDSTLSKNSKVGKPQRKQKIKPVSPLTPDTSPCSVTESETDIRNNVTEELNMSVHNEDSAGSESGQTLPTQPGVINEKQNFPDEITNDTDNVGCIVETVDKENTNSENVSVNKTPVKSKKKDGAERANQPQEEQIESPSVPKPKIRRGKTQTKTETTVAGPVKPKPVRRKKKEPPTIQSNTITDYFPVRRSSRQTKSEIEKEKRHQLEQQIKQGCTDGLQIKQFENKGRGIIATKAFSKGDFVVEYAGELIDCVEAKAREENYSKTPEVGCYMYYFICEGKQHCIDATKESGYFGRLVNHSREGNCCTRAVVVDKKPHLILVASRDIKPEEELCYDYGDRRKAVIEEHPWLKS